jgi:hypothetical protein
MWNTRRAKEGQNATSTIMKCKHMFIPIPDIAESEMVLNSRFINPEVSGKQVKSEIVATKFDRVRIERHWNLKWYPSASVQIGFMIMYTSISIDGFTPRELPFPHSTASFIDWHKSVDLIGQKFSFGMRPRLKKSSYCGSIIRVSDPQARIYFRLTDHANPSAYILYLIYIKKVRYQQQCRTGVLGIMYKIVARHLHFYRYGLVRYCMTCIILNQGLFWKKKIAW